MLSDNERLERKDRLLARLDPYHEVELDGAFLNHLRAAVRASSQSECQPALDKAAEAYENALDEALYEDGGILLRLAERDARRARASSGARAPAVFVDLHPLAY